MALQATLTYNIGGLERWRFYHYLHSRKGQSERLNKETLQLMKAVGAPLTEKDYDAQRWVPPVVDYWNWQHKNRHVFKVFVFSAIGTYRPIFCYGPENYNTPILLYHDQNHFDGVQKPGQKNFLIIIITFLLIFKKQVICLAGPTVSTAKQRINKHLNIIKNAKSDASTVRASGPTFHVHL